MAQATPRQVTWPPLKLPCRVPCCAMPIKRAAVASILSNYLDRKPTLVEPATVLNEITKSEAPDGYLRGLHPPHPQQHPAASPDTNQRSSVRRNGRVAGRS